MKKGKEIHMRELVNFCDEYNAIGFGKAKITELKSKIIIELYNAGFSENEELDMEFDRRYKSNIIMDYHPITIAEFSKLDLLYNTHVVGFENLKDWCDCYEERNTFRHMLEIS